MYNVNRQPIHKVKSVVYISKKGNSIIDDNENEIPTYEPAQKYYFNVQPLTDTSEIAEYGENANAMRLIVITQKDKYLNKFKPFDLVYCYTTPNSDFETGDGADYRIHSVRNQNTCIKIYLKKLVKSYSED